jgi:hypothetical protein
MYQFIAAAAAGIPLLVAAGMLARGRWALLGHLARPGVLTLCLPVVLLPLVSARPAFAALPLAVRLAATVLFLAPVALVVGCLAAGWMAGRKESGVVPAVLTSLAAGLSFGWEFSVPVARNFGLLFALVLGWVLIVAVARIAMHRRGAAAMHGGSGLA